MPPPSPTLRYLRRALQRGDVGTVAREGDRLAERLAGEPGRDAELGEVALIIGAAHATAGDLPAAETYLEAGLERLAADEAPEPAPGEALPSAPMWADGPTPTAPPQPSPPAAKDEGGPGTPGDPGDPAARRPAVPWDPPPPPPPPAPWTGPWNDPPWTDASPTAPPPRPARYYPDRDDPVADGYWTPAATARRADPWRPPAPPPKRTPVADRYEVLLCQVHLRTGRTGDAAERLGHLIEPHRDVIVRFDATRALATVAALAGRHERAHHLLNTAGGLAGRIPSRMRATLVDGDRAVLLAREGRLNEALALGERVLAPLVRPPNGPYQHWTRHEGASVALTLGRMLARGGDDTTARRLTDAAADALGPVTDPILGAWLDITGVVVARDLFHDEAEALLSRAAATFEHSGDRPAAAVAALEQGRLADARGLDRSARPRYRRAAEELQACGWTAEAREADALTATLDAGRPPPFRYGNVP